MSVPPPLPQRRAGAPRPSVGRALPVRRRRSRTPRPGIVIVACAVAVVAAAGLVLALQSAIGDGRADAAPSASDSPSPVASSPAPSAGSFSTSEPVPGSDAAAALAILDALPEASGAAPDYDRDLFGQRWYDEDRNGCDTRNDVLGRDLLDPVFKAGTNDCKVLAGTLIDPYDGTRVEFVSGQNTSTLVQIDHVVALAWAWHHGAYAWSDEQRRTFANDPRNLLAASQAMNQEKSAAGPAEWLPPVPELRCLHVERWVGVVGAYRLGIGADDRAAARALLEGCR